MNFEGLETLRVQHITTALEGMSAIIKDEKASPEMKIAAAKVIDAISDTIVKAYMMSNLTGTAERKTDKLMKQMDKLMDRRED